MYSPACFGESAASSSPSPSPAFFSASAIFFIMSRVFLISFFLTVFSEAWCCRDSLFTFRGRVSESTTPITKFR